MRLGREWIEEHIPHRGAMCLLQEVLEWDTSHTRCRSTTHRSPGNPLRADGRLGAACGIEYAAQTMAVHGALVASAAGTSAPPGFLASVRSVELNVDRLDDVQDDLITDVRRIAGDDLTAMYDFTVSGGERILLAGRATIAFNIMGT